MSIMHAIYAVFTIIFCLVIYKLRSTSDSHVTGNNRRLEDVTQKLGLDFLDTSIHVISIHEGSSPEDIE